MHGNNIPSRIPQKEAKDRKAGNSEESRSGPRAEEDSHPGRNVTNGSEHSTLRQPWFKYTNPVTFLEDQEQKYNPKCASQRKVGWARKV